jgi:hypothetical protein
MQVLFQPLPLTAIVHQPVNDKVISHSHRVCVAVHQHFTHTSHAISSYHDITGWCALSCRAASSTSWVSPGQPCCCSARSNGHIDVIKGTTAPGPGPMSLLIHPCGMHRPGQHARGVQTHKDLHTTGGWCGCICSADTSIPHATRFLYLLSCIAHMQHLTCGHLHAGPRWLTACCFNKPPPPLSRPSLLTSPGHGHCHTTWCYLDLHPGATSNMPGWMRIPHCQRLHMSPQPWVVPTACFKHVTSTGVQRSCSVWAIPVVAGASHCHWCREMVSRGGTACCCCHTSWATHAAAQGAVPH